MAPTETLAEQHFATIQRLLGAEPAGDGTADRLDARPARRAQMLARLESGELSLVVGTHALIEDAVRSRALAVAVVDEQHRFGVRQRAALRRQGAAVASHVLHMTATPIPRTLALRATATSTSAPCASSRRAAGRSRRRLLLGELERSGPTSGSPRNCAPGARRSSCARDRRGGEAADGQPSELGACRDRGVRAAAQRRAARLPARRCCTAQMRPTEKQAAMAPSLPGRRTCSSRPP